MSDSNQEVKYYDYLGNVLAYLKRLRKVTPNQGDSYYSVTLAALHGRADSEGKIDKTWIDCNVVGAQAIARIKTLLEHISKENIDLNEAKIMANFVHGDLRIEPFVYKSGPKAGQPGIGLKAHLLRISHVRVNGSPFDFGDEGDEPEGQSDEALENEPASGAENEQSRPAMVKLSKDDPDFLRKKADLKKQGYRWDPEQTAWCLPRTLAA